MRPAAPEGEIGVDGDSPGVVVAKRGVHTDSLIPLMRDPWRPVQPDTDLDDIQRRRYDPVCRASFLLHAVQAIKLIPQT
ncbi:unnamed protein product [Strongylus vulgaris]|uniref:Uncharacterized protein n=1 Tax=Strongylus vulgaris TaxID=40348 RepID=A0A3P7JB82_STRVU|nr:unnamed protein product [Strongylus vulgaris]